MKLIGWAVVALGYIVVLVGAVNALVEWQADRDRRRMGLGCWLYRIGIIRKER